MSTPDPPSRSDMSWDVAVQESNGVVTAKIMHASVGHDEASAIHGRMHQVLADAKKMKVLAFDLSEVTFMNSMGVGMCIDLRNKALASGARTFIIGLTPQLRALFKSVKVDELFELVDNPGDLQKKL